MIVRKIYYARGFVKDLRKLPNTIIKRAIEKEKVFKDNPLHRSLRLHELSGKLKGLWSISVTGSYRIIFERMDDGNILFVSIGKHDIYRSIKN